MVIIDNLFVYYKNPEQYIWAGENYIDIYKLVDKSYKKTRSFEDISIYNIEPDDFESVARELGTIDTGIVLNSNPYIYNFLDFEKLPFRDDMRQDIVDWRLRKVFPENLEDYDHNYYKLNKNKVLSVLLKKSTKEHLEELCKAHKINLIYLGNSTLNIMNREFSSKNAPDFFVEIDKNLIVIVFQNNSLPYYIRKFRCQNDDDAFAEISKTIKYVKNSYSHTPNSCSISAVNSPMTPSIIGDKLAGSDILPIAQKETATPFLPA